MSDCPDCDGTLTQDAYITGVVTRWHSDDYHAHRRAQLLRSARYMMTARAGRLDGHTITIRFTATEAWWECACGGVGERRLWSGAASAEGRAHQYVAGIQYLSWLDMVHLGEELGEPDRTIFDMIESNDPDDLPIIHPDHGGKLEIWAAEVWAKEQS